MRCRVKRVLAALLVAVFVALVVAYWRESDALYAAWAGMRPPESYWAPWLWYHLKMDMAWRVAVTAGVITLLPAALLVRGGRRHG